MRRGGKTPFARTGTLSVASGVTTRAEMDVKPAQWRRLRFVVDGECRRFGMVVAEDEAGSEVLRDMLGIPEDGETESVLLPEGVLRLSFRTPDGWTGEARVTVPGEDVIEMTLKRP